MHYGRVHSRLILVPRQKKRQSANGHSKELIKLTPERAPEAPVEKLKKPAVIRRQYRKKKVEAPIQVDILFCPSCLTDLHSVGVGMAMAKTNSKVNGCPKCGLDLRVVAAGMAVAQSGKV